MENKYFHYSNRFFTYEEIKNKNQGNNWKPDGLWLSIDDAWINWCNKEGFFTCNNCIVFWIS